MHFLKTFFNCLNFMFWGLCLVTYLTLNFFLGFYILDTEPLSFELLAKIFSQSVGSLFTGVMFFAVMKHFRLQSSHLLVVGFNMFTIRVLSESPFLCQWIQEYFLSPLSYQAVRSYIKFLGLFEAEFCAGWDKNQASFFYM